MRMMLPMPPSAAPRAFGASYAFAALAAVMLSAASADAVASDDLEAGFRAPPHSAKPHTWYHMMNGNVTKAGITRDFEELARVGIGGVQMFDAGCDIPPGGLDFNSPEWFDMFRHAASEARRLGLEICIPNCSGWSSSGGPWNPPSNGMKRVTFRLAQASGPGRVSLTLPRETNDNGFYADIGVFAFPTPAADKADLSRVTASVAPDGQSFTFASDRPFTLAGFSFLFAYAPCWSGDAVVSVEVADDGKSFRPLETFRETLARVGRCDTSRRFHSFRAKATARAFRVKIVETPYAVAFRDPKPSPRAGLSSLAAKLDEFRIPARIDDTPTTPDQVVAKSAVRDVTANLAADGTFTWDAPAGDWTILRIGYLCDGRKNHPASDHGVGLEVDKLSAEALDYHFEQYVGRLCRTLGPLAGAVASGFNNILVDSYEVGTQNWTQKMEEEFLRRRGYSIRPCLPAFAGFVVDDVPTTERFLEDFRRVVADLFAENYAGALMKKCHEYGLLFSLEPYGNGPSDNLQYGRYCDIPMAEFWSRTDPTRVDTCESKFVSSAAHVWGRKVCGAEAFSAFPSANSGRWMTTPFCIKAQGDAAFAAGVNRVIYHRFAHQPWADDRYLPGMTMGKWGMHLDRTQTWWDFSAPWFAYQARCQFLLQQGTFCADVLYLSGLPFIGEEVQTPLGVADGPEVQRFYALPYGYTYDICADDALAHLTVDDDGRVVAPGGVRYRVLAIPPFREISLETLGEIARLRTAGATLVWMRRPVRALGLKGGKDESDRKVRALTDAIWAQGVSPDPLAATLASHGVAPDFAIVSNPSLAPTSWIHRRDDAADWYFVAMPNQKETTLTASFRETGRLPELWDPETATVAPAETWYEKDGRTVVEVPLTVSGSKFVVFRKPVAADATPRLPPPPRPAPQTVAIPVEGAWTVKFPQGFLPNRLAAAQEAETVTFDTLLSWPDSPNDGVRYFSGTATYEKSIPTDVIAQARRPGCRVELDLGDVKHFAEVTANGRLLATLWKPPFRVDVTDVLKDGEPLDLKIRVTNLWANRLIGDDVQFADDCEWTGDVRGGAKEIGIKEIPQWVKDGRKSPTGRCTFTTWKHWDKNDKPLPSGILGPVTLRASGTLAPTMQTR